MPRIAPLLIVCRLSQRNVWLKAAVEWLLPTDVDGAPAVILSKAAASALVSDSGGAGDLPPVVIISYGLVASLQASTRRRFKMLLVDDAHDVREAKGGPTTALCPAIRTARRVLLLTSVASAG